MDNSRLTEYLDDKGRVTRWPARRNKEDRKPILDYLASQFESGTMYNERQVNEILKQKHTFEDWALLRREMIMQGHFQRNRSGSQYWLAKQTIAEYQPKEF